MESGLVLIRALAKAPAPLGRYKGSMWSEPIAWKPFDAHGGDPRCIRGKSGRLIKIVGMWIRHIALIAAFPVLPLDPDTAKRL